MSIVRWLSGLLLSAVASSTVQRVVQTISSANRTTKKPNSFTIWLFIAPPVSRAASETSSSSASSTKLATIEAPP